MGTVKTLVVSICVVIVAMICSLTFLAVEGKDGSQVLGFVAPYLTLAIPMLLNQWTSLQQKQTLDRVDKNVNGHLTALSRAAGIVPDDTPKEPD